MSNKSILFISNGYGEDTIAACVIEKLKELLPKAQILAFPLVGEGKAYKDANVKIVSPTLNLPSGGLMPGDYVGNLIKDSKAGLIKLTLNQIKALKKIKDNIDCVVASGDILPVLMAGLFVKKPLVFIGTAKSSYFDPYGAFERFIFKKYAKISLIRDDYTAGILKKQGLNAAWAGNAMMDCIPVTGDRFGIPEDKKIITILPGSRDFAYDDLPVMLEAADIISKSLEDKPAYLMALAGTLEFEPIEKNVSSCGFTLIKNENKNGVVGILKSDNSEILLLKRRFGDSITLADIVIGQAGTGNEQAAGLGKPVIGFDSAGRKKAGWYRARQKGLLGDALSVVERNAEAVANEALAILNDKNKYDHMAKIGKERMGPAGGAEKIAKIIAEFCNL